MIRRLSLITLFALILFSNLLFGCSAKPKDRVIDLIFDGITCQSSGPEIVDSGKTIIKFNNLSDGYFLLDVLRLNDGKSWQDILDYFGDSGAFHVRRLGVSGRSVQGNPNALEFNLKPGEHAIICMYMGPETNGTWPAAPINIRSNSSD